MAGWIKRLALAAAGFAAAFAASGAQAATPWQPSEDDALILELHAGQYRIGDTIRGYQTPQGVCVDLADLIIALDLPVRLDKKSRRATGWIFAEDQRFTLDREANTVQTVNTGGALAATAVRDTPEGWCTDLTALSAWFGVRFRAELGTMTIRLESDRKLPFLEAIERKSRAARLSKGKPAEFDIAKLPQAETPYRDWRAPSVDVLLRAQWQRTRAAGGSLTGQYEVLASGEVLGASTEVRLASNSNGIPDSLRLRAYRYDPAGTLLGPLRATQVAAGDVEVLPGALTGQSAVGRGAFVSNRPIDRPTRFSATTLRGALPSGWDAELYINGELRAYQADRGDGRYEFTDIDLQFGDNDFDVVLYGPQGQIRHDRSNMPVGLDSLPKGQTWYWAGVIQQDRDLITLTRNPDAAKGGWRWGMGIERGLDERTTAGLGWQSLVLNGRRRNYLETTLGRSVGPMLVQLSGAQQMGAGQALRAEALGRLGGIHFSAETLLALGRYESELVSPNTHDEQSLRLSGRLKLGQVSLPLQGGMRRWKMRDGRETLEWSARASFRFGRLFLGTELSQKRSSGPASAAPSDGTFIQLIGNSQIRGVRLRGEASWRLAGARHGLNAATLTAEKTLGERSTLRGAYSYDQDSRINQFTLGYVRQFKRFALRGDARYDTRGGIGLGLSLAFSLGPNPADGGWRVSREQLAQTGTAAVEVFRDDNGDGLRQSGEGAVEGVTIEAGFRHSRTPTNAAGRTVVEGLRPFVPVLVGIDTGSLPDPLLQPKGRGLVVTPRPGVASTLLLPLAPTGEIEATLVGLDGEARAGQTIELVDAAGEVVRRMVSEFDGYVLFDSIPYGEYRLRLGAKAAAAMGVRAELGAALRIDRAHSSLRLGRLRMEAAATGQIAATP
jgi:hypothetical protein